MPPRVQEPASDAHECTVMLVAKGFCGCNRACVGSPRQTDGEHGHALQFGPVATRHREANQLHLVPDGSRDLTCCAYFKAGLTVGDERHALVNVCDRPLRSATMRMVVVGSELKELADWLKRKQFRRPSPSVLEGDRAPRAGEQLNPGELSSLVEAGAAHPADAHPGIYEFFLKDVPGRKHDVDHPAAHGELHRPVPLVASRQRAHEPLYLDPLAVRETG
jgi:hypothetical protein